MTMSNTLLIVLMFFLAFFILNVLTTQPYEIPEDIE